MLKIFSLSSDRLKIFQLLCTLKNTEELEGQYSESKERIVDYLHNAYNRNHGVSETEKKNQAIQDFIQLNKDLQDENFDTDLVRCARLITHMSLRANTDSEILAFILEDEKNFLLEKVLRMEEEAEGVELFFLPLALGIVVKQANFFEDLIYTSYPSETKNPDNPDKIEVSIISKMKGHYDILYSIQDMEEEEYCIRERTYYYEI